MKRIAFIATAVAVMVLGIFAYAGAASQPATSTVNVKATVNPKITLSLDSSTVDFGTIDPETTGSKDCTLTVQSNKTYTVVRGDETGYAKPTGATPGTFAAAMGLTMKTAAPFDSSVQAKTASSVLTDKYTYNIPWTTDDGNYSANYTYTVTQQ